MQIWLRLNSKTLLGTKRKYRQLPESGAVLVIMAAKINTAVRSLKFQPFLTAVEQISNYLQQCPSRIEIKFLRNELRRASPGELWSTVPLSERLFVVGGISPDEMEMFRLLTK